MATIEAVQTKPKIILTLEWDEALGLATLLQGGTWPSLDEVLNLGNLPTDLDRVINSLGGDLLGHFKNGARLGAVDFVPR